MAFPKDGETRIRGRRLERLNALRGPAALLVVLYHVRQIALRDMGSAGSFEFWRFGHSGVDLFFVISGFVIYLVHRGDIGKPSATRRFATRRLVRIYPPLWIITTGVLIGALLAAHAVRPEKLNAWFIVRSYSLWPIPDALPLLPPAWTLSHELKFYFLFALAISLPARVWKPVLATVFVGSLITGIAQLLTHVALPFALSFFFSPYNLEFAAGVALVPLVMGGHIRSAWPYAVLGVMAWVGAAAIDPSLPAPDAAQVIRYGVPSALLVLAVASRDVARPAFRAPLLRLLGNASYSIYLMHLPVIIVAIRVANAHAVAGSTALFVGIAAFATVVGVAFHLVIERPITRLLTARLAPAHPGAATRSAEIGQVGVEPTSRRL